MGATSSKQTFYEDNSQDIPYQLEMEAQDKMTKSKLEAAMGRYDYIELIAYDIHSTPRGRMVAKRKLPSMLKSGIGVFSPICFGGILDQRNMSDFFAKNRNYTNSYLVPILETIVDVPRSIRGDNKIGQILCDLRTIGGAVDPTTPRYVAEQQLAKLSALGYNVKSSFEMEFSILDKDNQPWGHRRNWLNMEVIEEQQEILIGLMRELGEAGVMCDAVHAEGGTCQYEYIMDLAEGITGPDMTTRFKSMTRMFLKKRNLKSVFLSKFWDDKTTNGLHFNHSIWTHDGQSVFYNPDHPKSISIVGEQWLAGLVKHGAAITALLSPTINCYRRLNRGYLPSKSNWSYSRLTSFRVVAEKDGNVYIEDRRPSSACNPYIVMAAVVAAGLDGLNNQLNLDDANQDKHFPKDLGSALHMLQEDACIVKALGKEFVEQFCLIKQLHEVDYFKSLGNLSDEELFAKEMEIYLGRV